jgi:hypothetical protein
MSENELHFDSHRFIIESATFRYITHSHSGAGWDFNFTGRCLTDDDEEPKYPYGIRLSTEAGSLQLEPRDDMTGTYVELNSPYDEESGEPYFDLNVMELHDIPKLLLDFVERCDNQYLIKIVATVAKTVTGRLEPLSLLAWTRREADHAYPT